MPAPMMRIGPWGFPSGRPDPDYVPRAPWGWKEEQVEMPGLHLGDIVLVVGATRSQGFKEKPLYYKASVKKISAPFTPDQVAEGAPGWEVLVAPVDRDLGLPEEHWVYSEQIVEVLKPGNPLLQLAALGNPRKRRERRGEKAKRNGFYRSKRKPWWEKVPEYLSELEEIKRQRHPKGYTRAEKSRIAILEKNIQHAKRKIQDMAEEEHQKLRKSLILQASCPHCGAGQGSVCVTPSGDPAGYSRKTRSRFHAPRWRRLDELMQSELWVLAQLPFAVENPKGKEVRKRHTQKQRRQRGKRLTEEQTEKFLPPGVGDRKREFVARIESYRPALLRQYADQIEQGKPAWYFESSYILKHARQVGMPVAELVHLLRETALRRETETAWRHRRAYGYVDWSNVVPEGDKPYWTDSTGERHRRDYEFVWKNVFGEPDAGTAGAGPGPFGREHVAQVVKSVHIRVPPDSDWPDDYYFALFRLVDGRWGYVEAWNDSTGWGCQDSNAYAVSDTLDGLIPQMSDRGRYQLGFESPLQRLSAAFVK